MSQYRCNRTRLVASARAWLLAEGEPIEGEELSPVHGDDVAIGVREANIIIERRTGGRRHRRVFAAQHRGSSCGGWPLLIRRC